MKSILSLTLLCGFAFAQQPQPKIVVHLDPVQPVKAKPGQIVNVTLTARIDPGYHVNAEKQNGEYVIPIQLTWTPGVLDKAAVTYPKYETLKLAFAEKPVNVHSGELRIETRFKVAQKAMVGAATVAGKLRYQACSDRECLIPRTIDIAVPVEIVK